MHARVGGGWRTCQQEDETETDAGNSYSARTRRSALARSAVGSDVGTSGRQQRAGRHGGIGIGRRRANASLRGGLGRKEPRREEPAGRVGLQANQRWRPVGIQSTSVLEDIRGGLRGWAPAERQKLRMPRVIAAAERVLLLLPRVFLIILLLLLH